MANDEELYQMNMDEEDEENYAGDELYEDNYDMNMDEEDEDYEAPSGVANPGFSASIDLGTIVEALQTYRKFVGLEGQEMFFRLNALTLDGRLGNTDSDLLLRFSPDDVKYKAFITDLQPEMIKRVPNGLGSSSSLTSNLLLASIMLIWSEIENQVTKQGLDQDTLKSNIDGKYNFYPKPSDRGITPFLNAITRDWSEAGQNGKLALDSALKVLIELNSLAKPNEKQTAESKVNEDKSLYIKQLEKKGFKSISNNTVISGRTGIHDILLGVLKQCYQEAKVLHFKDKANMVNELVLEQKGFNPKTANIWDSPVYTSDEDLMFRAFIREDDASFTILIKLPNGVENFDFSSYRGQEQIQSIPALFSNSNPSKGRTYSSSLMKPPRVCNLGSTRKVNCVYNCVEIKMSKDLMAFKNANWALRDYIHASKGADNIFSTFDELPLGEKIVVGVMPGELKAERFDCTGKYNVSGIVGGGAGSGKTAMYDSLLVQGLALSGREGNGATILIDPKQEWIPIWRNIFKQMNVPFYGFDGTILNNSDIKWVVDRRGTKTVEEIPFKVSSYLGGILFVRVIYETIQVILKATGCSDILEFNDGNHSYKGITRLPRTMILVDELNTLYSNLGTDKLTKGIYKGLVIARLTRTSGFLWFLGGQDPSKTLIQSDERSNYGYNIFGKMDDDRYEYFNVVQNRAVIEYEERNRTSDNPNPILSQGIFYAGKQGKTDLVKCMFVPKDERMQVLQDLQSNFEGMFELDKLVKLALKKGYFDTLETTLKVPNNIIYATLKHLGVISQQEFNTYSDRVLNGEGSEDADNLNDILEAKDLFADSYQKPGNFKPSDPVDFNVGSQQRMNNKPTDSVVKPSLNKINADDTMRNQYKQSPDLKEPYTGKVGMSNAGFSARGTSTGVVNALNVIKDTSKLLLNEITRYFGNLSKVVSINIKTSGLLVINNVPFKPQFDPEDIEAMPEYIRNDISKGHVAELFNFGNLYKFRNLQLLEIGDSMLAEGRMRREMGISRNKPWSHLFNKFSSLKKIVIGNQVITDEETAQGYDKAGRGGYTDEAFAKLPSFMGKMWNTKPAKFAMSALGYTAGFKALLLVSTLFGPWGLFYSAMVGAVAYHDYRDKHPHKPPQQPKQPQRQNRNGQNPYNQNPNNQNGYGQGYGQGYFGDYSQAPRQRNNDNNSRNNNRNNSNRNR